MNRFDVNDLPLEGLKLITRKKIGDNRGFFSRVFCAEELEEFIDKKQIMQINHSFTQKKNSIRGLHYQINPFCETKIVNCIKGSIFDIAVDIRTHSKTYLHYYAIELSEDSNDALLIPEGFAHGFQTLSDNVELLYFHTMPYNKDFERGINPLDKTLNVDWPFPALEMSERDKNLPMIDDFFDGVEL